jgi:hypothetical protein
MTEPAELGQTPPATPAGEREDVQPGQQPYAYVNAEGFLTFTPPDPPTLETASLVADIVDLDHRIHRRLGVGSSDWEEVMGILKNAANMTMWGRPDEARQLYGRAEAVWRAHLEERNRLRYLAGVGIGIVPAAAVAFIAVLMLARLSPGTASAHTLVLVCLFAVFGSATSVLTRLSSIPLAKETSTLTLLVSGAARPVVAELFALTVHLAIVANHVAIRVGPDTTGVSDSAAAAVAFAVGFSERLAKDIIVRISGDNAAPSA